MKLIPADNMKDKLWGKIGTPEHDAMEAKLRKEANAWGDGESIHNIHLLQNLPQNTERLFIPKNTVLLKKGKVADKLYLIHNGCLRLYFYNNGNDVTFQFFFEDDIVASFDSLYFQQPSQFYLESIEPTEVYAIKREDFYRLVEESMEVRKLYEEKLIERFHTYQQLFLDHIKYTPQQRYEKLIKEEPKIIQRVPQHYIASYLGITPVSLSRIRNRR